MKLEGIDSRELWLSGITAVLTYFRIVEQSHAASFQSWRSARFDFFSRRALRKQIVSLRACLARMLIGEEAAITSVSIPRRSIGGSAAQALIFRSATNCACQKRAKKRGDTIDNFKAQTVGFVPYVASLQLSKFLDGKIDEITRARARSGVWLVESQEIDNRRGALAYSGATANSVHDHCC